MRVASARQSGCGCALFEFSIQYGIWSARHADVAFENYDWRSGCIHDHSFVFVTAVHQWHEFSLASRRAAADSSSDTNACSNAATNSVCNRSRSSADVDSANAVARTNEEEMKSYSKSKTSAPVIESSKLSGYAS